jgi:hypothetical protein
MYTDKQFIIAGRRLDSFQEVVTAASSNDNISCKMWDDLAGKLDLPPSLTFEETMEIMDDTAIVESVSSPPEDDDDEPEPQCATRSFPMCQRIKDLYWKNGECFRKHFEMTDDLEHFVRKGMPTKMKQRKIEAFFNVK